MDSKIPKLYLDSRSKNVFINDVIKSDKGLNILNFCNETNEIILLLTLTKTLPLLPDLALIIMEYNRETYLVKYNISYNKCHIITFELDGDISFYFSIAHYNQFQKINKESKEYMRLNKSINNRLFDNVIKETIIQVHQFFTAEVVIYDYNSIYVDLFNMYIKSKYNVDNYINFSWYNPINFTKKDDGLELQVATNELKDYSIVTLRYEIIDAEKLERVIMMFKIIFDIMNKLIAKNK